MITSRLLPIAVSLGLAGLASEGLHRLLAHDRRPMLPATVVVLALALSLAVAVFVAPLTGALLLIPAALTGLPYAGRPAVLLAGALIAVFAVGEVALWRLLIPLTMPPPR